MSQASIYKCLHKSRFMLYDNLPGTRDALPVVPDSDFNANSMFFRGKPISMSCRTMGNGGTGEVFCFFCLGGLTCCTVIGVVASLELLSSNRGEDGWADSTARN